MEQVNEGDQDSPRQTGGEGDEAEVQELVAIGHHRFCLRRGGHVEQEKVCCQDTQDADLDRRTSFRIFVTSFYFV